MSLGKTRIKNIGEGDKSLDLSPTYKSMPKHRVVRSEDDDYRVVYNKWVAAGKPDRFTYQSMSYDVVYDNDDVYFVENSNFLYNSMSVGG